jgi:hypothetical protein
MIVMRRNDGTPLWVACVIIWIGWILAYTVFALVFSAIVSLLFNKTGPGLNDAVSASLIWFFSWLFVPLFLWLVYGIVRDAYTELRR